jgi:hypothetical protein
MPTNGIITTINGHAILRPLGIEFRPFENSAHDTKYHTWCNMIVVKWSKIYLNVYIFMSC